jgi:hypothetical protein
MVVIITEYDLVYTYVWLLSGEIDMVNNGPNWLSRLLSCRLLCAVLCYALLACSQVS